MAPLVINRVIMLKYWVIMSVYVYDMMIMTIMN